jgi:hypothetical protein
VKSYGEIFIGTNLIPSTLNRNWNLKKFVVAGYRVYPFKLNESLSRFFFARFPLKFKRDIAENI